jgi:hypothetical protein
MSFVDLVITLKAPTSCERRPVRTLGFTDRDTKIPTLVRLHSVTPNRGLTIRVAAIVIVPNTAEFPMRAPNMVVWKLTSPLLACQPAHRAALTSSVPIVVRTGQGFSTRLHEAIATPAFARVTRHLVEYKSFAILHVLDAFARDSSLERETPVIRIASCSAIIMIHDTYGF